MSNHRRLVLSILLAVVLGILFAGFDFPKQSGQPGDSRSRPSVSSSVAQGSKRPRSVDDVLEWYGPQARKRLQPLFKRVGHRYPPERIALLGFKQERMLELWSRDKQQWRRIKTYSLTAFSGVLGPKLKEGDRQIPEGIYKIVGLNPNSSFHLSMKLNYPNSFDLHYANKEKRTQPGSNIFIHGRDKSIGCLAIGDSNIEELFVLARETGIANSEVIVAPYDMRRADKNTVIQNKTAWLPVLYQNIRQALRRFRLPEITVGKN